MSNTPTSIGRYEVLGSIGRGGMGSLFLALDPLLDRQIAVKLLRDDDDELRERFAREARAAARLRHPNIVTIFDVGDHEGQPFIAMEYIQGQTLAEVVRGNVALPLTRKLELIEALCDGLGFAHRGGIVHRDIKPANLMIDADGSLKILDFGIARAAESSGMTQAGMLIGTLNYMSPEQVSGQPVDARSDLFAVGAVFYELISYRQAFPGGLMAGVLNKILSGQPDPLSSIVPDLDPEIVAIVDRALQKEPDRRYQDLSAMRQDVSAVRARLTLSGQTVVMTSAPPPTETGTPRPTPSSARRSADLEEIGRRRSEQIQKHVSEAERRLEAGEAEAAIAVAEQALLLDTGHGRAHELIDRARALIEARQLDEALEAAAGGLAGGDLAVAGDQLARAATIDPDAPRVQSMRRSLDEAIERQEEARRREALEARVREAIGEAERQFGAGRHEDALALLAGFKPSHPLVAQALERLRREAGRIADEARAAAERAEKAAAEKQAREREKAATAAIAEARRAGDPAAALEILRKAVAKDPENVDLLRAVGANEAELKAREDKERQKKAEEDQRRRKKAEEDRRREEKAKADKARQEREKQEQDARVDIDDPTILIKREPPARPPSTTPSPPAPPAPAEGATQERAVRPSPPEAPVPSPAAKVQPEATPAAAPAAAARSTTPVAAKPPQPPQGGLAGGNAIKYGGAAAAVLLLGLGFMFFGGGGEDVPPADAAIATEAGLVAGGPAAAEPAGSDGVEDGTADVSAGPEPTAAAETPPAGASAGRQSSPPPAPSSPPPPATAPSTANGNAQLDRELNRLFADATRQRATGDRHAALQTIEGALARRAGDDRFTTLAADIRNDAQRRAEGTRNTAREVGAAATALDAFGDGENLLGQATREPNSITAARLYLAAEAQFNTALAEGRKSAAAAAERERAAEQQRALAAQKANAADTRAAEEQAIRAIVERYREAYNNLDANTVSTVFPAAPVAALRKAFSGFESQAVTFGNVAVTLDEAGTGATVRAQVRTVVKPRGASEQTSNAPMVLTLQKKNGWIITSRR